MFIWRAFSALCDYTSNTYYISIWYAVVKHSGMTLEGHRVKENFVCEYSFRPLDLRVVRHNNRTHEQDAFRLLELLEAKENIIKWIAGSLRVAPSLSHSPITTFNKC